MRIGSDIITNFIGWLLYKTSSNRDINKQLTSDVTIFSVRFNPNSGYMFTSTRRHAILNTSNSTFYKVTTSCWVKFTGHSDAYL